MPGQCVSKTLKTIAGVTTCTCYGKFTLFFLPSISKNDTESFRYISLPGG